MKFASILCALLASVMIIALAHGVSAQFNVAYNIDEHIIREEGRAQYTFIVENDGDEADNIRMTFTDVDWTLRTSPTHYYFSGIPVEAHSRTTFTLTLSPGSGLPYNLYLINIRFISERTGEATTVSLPVEFQPIDYEGPVYRTAVRWAIDAPRSVDPRESLPVTIDIRNRNPRDIEEFVVSISSPYFSDVQSFPLRPLAEERVEFDFPLSRDLDPQEFDLSVKFTADDEELLPVEVQSVRIEAYEDVRTHESQSGGFFRRDALRTYENRGNAPASVEGAEQVSFLSRPFLTVFIDDARSERSFVTNSSGTYATWNLDLERDETRTVQLVYNYMLLFWIVLFIVLGGGVYQLMKSPILIKKDAVVVGVTEGGISEIRVVIHLKNRSARRFKDLTIVDSIPKLAEFVPEKDDSYNATRLYRNEKEGSVVKWNLDSLEKYEERIFTYRVRSKLSIIGGLHLPRTIIRFSDEQGSEQVSRSNGHKINL